MSTQKLCVRESILDGRHRYNACRELGIEVWGRKWEGGMDPIEYVVSNNIHRRHLTTTQRAKAAALAMDYHAAEAKERQRAAGGDRKSEEYQKSLTEPVPEAIKQNQEARDAAGRLFGVSGRSVSDAKYVLDHGTDEEKSQLDEPKTPLKPQENQSRPAKTGNKKQIPSVPGRTNHQAIAGRRATQTAQVGHSGHTEGLGPGATVLYGRKAGGVGVAPPKNHWND